MKRASAIITRRAGEDNGLREFLTEHLPRRFTRFNLGKRPYVSFCLNERERLPDGSVPVFALVENKMEYTGYNVQRFSVCKIFKK